MTLGVAGGLFGEIRLDGLRKIDARLVGQTDQHPQHVGHLIGEAVPLAGLERLVAVGARITRANSPTSSVRTAILVSSLK